MPCVLRITGRHFDVTNFLKETGLDAFLQFKAGDEIGFKRRGKTKYETNGCSFDLSTADFTEFERQKADAIIFLSSHFEKLQRLWDYGLEKDDIPEIDFGIESKSNSLAVHGESLQPELLKLASDLKFGIKISLYERTSFANRK